MTQLKNLINKAKNGKRMKEIFIEPSSETLLGEVIHSADELESSSGGHENNGNKSSSDELTNQISILDTIIFKEITLDKAYSEKLIYELEVLAQSL